ncbi:phage virion morphogenesis protein [Aquipseudomonas alcaligenes]|jgi:phage virion morphogenesis protein|uniref:Phage virion morphogenesis protein n=1 Tax=Aquipseudomonas alcaligenes TaxID=43263 RepID=A0AA42SR31_AQUAC|nr:phage virion morphogenesis protein [Pseudomonas alcaligenes]MDH1055605.1 phage virion morphogenesis protein [Pseudomonas alcaligenes]
MIVIDLDTRSIEASLKRLEWAVGDLRPALKNIGEALLKSTDQRFADRQSPDGEDWQDNSDVTEAIKGFNEPLVGVERNLTLRDGNNYQVQGGTLIVGNTLEYAAMQQFGGNKSEFPHLWGDIPARPFIGLSDDDRETIVEIITDHLAMAAGTL